MSVENVHDDDDGSSTGDRHLRKLVALLHDIGEDAEPWKLRLCDDDDSSVLIFVSGRVGEVRGRLDRSGYEVEDLESPTEDAKWAAAWKLS